MSQSDSRYCLFNLMLFVALSLISMHVEAKDPSTMNAGQHFKEGNWAEALAQYRQELDSAKGTPKHLQQAISCLQNLNRIDQVDELLGTVVRRHPDSAELHAAVGEAYQRIPEYGAIVAGEFVRGNQRGNNPIVQVGEIDRIKSINHLLKAIELTKDKEDETNRLLRANCYHRISLALMENRSYRWSWRLQMLTDLDNLPEPIQGWNSYAGVGKQSDPPVDDEGNPILYEVPDSWEAAKSDGERWRWANLQHSIQFYSDNRGAGTAYANFLETQFGLQNLDRMGWTPRQEDGKPNSQFDFASLEDHETIARLANGVRRFELPEGHRYLELYREGKNWDSLAQAYLNRTQRSKAAEALRHAIEAEKHPRARKRLEERLSQIIDPWCVWLPTKVHLSGEAPKLLVKHRNAEVLSFSAKPVDVKELLNDIQERIENQVNKISHHEFQVEQLGWRLLQKNQEKYLGEVAAKWTSEIELAKDHADQRTEIEVPLTEPGAYLVELSAGKSSKSRIVVWITDTVIARKTTARGPLYMVLDSKTGKPVADAKIDLLGYDQFTSRPPNKKSIETKRFSLTTSNDGLVLLDLKEQDRKLSQNFSWLSIATTSEGRLAHLGFDGLWFNPNSWLRDLGVKTFCLTDRPVYLPEDTVSFKVWIDRPSYESEPDNQKNPFAHKAFQVRIHDPRGDKVWEEQLTADNFGGVEASYQVPSSGTLGRYRIEVVGHGGGSFRVEEYRKPEFKVTVDAPTEPIQLGDTFKATIHADYYFGSPLKNAKVSYRVMRSSSNPSWYPPMPWDWLYGGGYGWLGIDANWHPSWRRWGCIAPQPPWFPQRNGAEELVAEGEADISEQGTYELKIDTSDALARNPNEDYRYRVIAEVTDASRRTISGSSNLLAAKSPVRATIWLDRGYYVAGDTISTTVSVRTPDGKPVAGEGRLQLMRLKPGGEEGEPAPEDEVQSWNLPSDAEGYATLKVKASVPGRYRLVYTSLAIEEARAEAGVLFSIRGEAFDDSEYRYNDLELILDRTEYSPGDSVQLLINTNAPDSTVALFLRPIQGIYQTPEMIHLQGKSTVFEMPIEAVDQPNFYVEAITVAEGKLHSVTKQIVVPPKKRIIEVEAEPSADAYLPGQKASLKIRLLDETGEPIVGQATVAIYDKSIDAIAGGEMIGDIRKQFWDWRWHHHPRTEHNLSWIEQVVTPKGIKQMQHLGLYSVERWNRQEDKTIEFGGVGDSRRSGVVLSQSAPVPMMAPASREVLESEIMESPQEASADFFDAEAGRDQVVGEEIPNIQVRKNFADTALWVGSVETDENGFAELPFELPESLTSWRIRVWGMASGTRVGEGSAEVVTRKDMMVRLQIPRFLVETDEATISAIVNNYLPVDQSVRVKLEADGEGVSIPSDTEQIVTVPAGGEARVDWSVLAKVEGEVKFRAIALTVSSDQPDETPDASDAMQLTLPVLVHGAERVESFSEVLAKDDSIATFEINIPEKRRPEASLLEFHYRPSLVGAMVEALPYLIDYPHGCTEQTLNRFLPAAITQRVLLDMEVDLDAIEQTERDGPGHSHNPVYSQKELDEIVRTGVNRLAEMQLGDGGWGWFSGFQERSSAHTTAVVIRGLLVARENGVEVPDEVINRGINWLEEYRAKQIRLLANCKMDGAPIDENKPYKQYVDNLDALVQLTLARAGKFNVSMRDRLVDERLKVSRYSLGLIGLALHMESKTLEDQAEQKAITGDRDRVIRNLKQFVVVDDENQTAYLELGGTSWWYWYGSEFETHASFLQLLSATEPQGDLAPKLVKYLLNNRRHAARWDSTRDTALVVEAMADYHRALLATSEEAASEPMEVEVWLDGKKQTTTTIQPSESLLFDGIFRMAGEELTTGRHTLEIRKLSGDRLYLGGMLSNFTMESDIRVAGLEVKVDRKMTKLIPVTADAETVDQQGAVVKTQERKYRRVNLPNLGEVESGELVEVELTISSKNDYEYLLIEDPKGAGLEPVDVRSGYNGNGLGAYVEFRDERVSFYVTRLPRGTHTLKYRLRAETPGKFAALPAQISAMYAPELRGNSDEQHVVITEEE